MFSKNCQVLGKSFLSAKDSRAFRDILLESHCLNSIAGLWCENASILSGVEEQEQEQQKAKQQKQVAALLLQWLGVSPSANSVSFTGEVVQGIIRGTENAGKFLAGVYSLRDNQNSSPSTLPLAFSILPPSSPTTKIALPPNQDDVVLSLQSTFKLAQLWQLALAATFLREQDDREDEGEQQQGNGNKKSLSSKKNKEDDDESDEEEEEEEEESDDDEDQDSSSSATTPTSIIFKLSSILFPPQTTSSAVLETLRTSIKRNNANNNTLQLFPAVLCHTEVSDRLFRGSDLMTPGTFYQGRIVKYLKPGTLTYVIPLGHYVPIAVGPLHEDITIKLPPPVEVSLPPAVPTVSTTSASTDEQDKEEKEDETDEQNNKESETSQEENNDDDNDDAQQQQQQASLEQLKLLAEYKRQHSIYRSSMPSYSDDTKSIKVATCLGDTFWKACEVSYAKSCSLQKYSVFPTSAGKLLQEEKSSVTLLMAQLASLKTSSSLPSAEDQNNNNKKKQKPIPKNKQGGGKKGGKDNNKQNSSESTSSLLEAGSGGDAASSLSKNERKPHILLLRWLLNESSPAPFPAGVVLSTPPKIIAPDDDSDDEDEEQEQEDLYSKNNHGAFALVASSIASSLAKSATNTDADGETQQMERNNSTSSSALEGGKNLTEELLQAATFVTLSNITKDQLPVPLSQFGAKLQAHLPTNSVSSSLLDWSKTKWKKPINLLREYAKPSKQYNNNSANDNKKNKNSNKKLNDPQQQQSSSTIDLTNDWVVELVEQGQGNFVIQSINKTSGVFRDHKKSTDSIHELLRSSGNSQNANDGSASSSLNDDASGNEYSSQTRGKFTDISPGFLSHRSGLTPELDLVIFGDPKEARKITAAAAEAKEQAKFPSLGNDDQNQQQQPVAASGEIELDEFCTIEEAKRKLALYARSCNFVVTKQDASNPAVVSPGAKPGDFKVEGALKGLWGTNAPLSATIDDLMKKVSIQLQKGTLLRFAGNENQYEIRKGTPPALTLSAKQVHNHWVTTLTGQFGYYLDVNLAAELIKRKLACSARVEDAPATKTQSKSSLSLVLTGRHVDDLLNLFEQEFGVGREWIQQVNVAAAKKK